MLKGLVGVLVGCLIFGVAFYLGYRYGVTDTMTGMVVMMSQGR